MSARISLWRARVPVSRPLADRTTGLSLSDSGSMDVSSVRVDCAGTARIMMSASLTSVLALTRGSRTWPGRADPFVCEALISAACAGLRTTRVTVRPAMAAACARAVPQAPPPNTATVSSAMAIHAHVLVLQRPAGACGDGEGIGGVERQALGSGPGDHGAIVGAERNRGDDELGAEVFAGRFEGFGNALIGGDATGDDEANRLARKECCKALQGLPGAETNDLGDSFLKTGSDISHILVGERGQRLGLKTHGGFEAREGKIEPLFAHKRFWELEPLGISLLGDALDGRAARMAKGQELGDLVEGFAERVVDGAAPALVVADAADEDELAMAARNQQHQVGKLCTIG